MADELLLDTRAFVALVDRDEKAHADCVAALESRRGFATYRINRNRAFQIIP